MLRAVDIDKIGSALKKSELEIKAALERGERTTALKCLHATLEQLKASGLEQGSKSKLQYRFLADCIGFNLREFAAKRDFRFIAECMVCALSAGESEEGRQLLLDDGMWLRSYTSQVPGADFVQCCAAYVNWLRQIHAKPEQLGPSLGLLGLALQREGRYREAISALSQCMKTGYCYGDAGDPVADMNPLKVCLANCFLESGRYEEAMRLAGSLVSSKDLLDTRHSGMRAMSLILLGESYLRRQQYREAKAPLLSALDICDRGTPGYYEFELSYAMEYKWCFGSKKFDKTRVLEDIALVEKNIGGSNTFSKRLAEYSRGLQESRDKDEFSIKASELWSAFGHGRKSDLLALDRIVSLMRRAYSAEPADLAYQLNLIVVKCVTLDLIPEAKSYGQEGAQILQKAGMHETTQYGQIISNLGRAQDLAGEYDAAKSNLKQAMQLRTREFNGYAISEGWLGRVYLHEGKLDDTEKTLIDVIAYRDKHNRIGPKFTESAANFIDLANAQILLNKPTEALRALERAAEIRKGIDPQKLTPAEAAGCKSISLFALARLQLNDHEAAEKGINQAKSATSSIIEPHDEVADTFDNIAAYYAQIDQPQIAHDWLQKALDMRILIFGSGHPLVRDTELRLKQLGSRT